MTDWATISSLATGAGTLVLAIATFASVKSANRAARVAERGLLAAQRPILIPSREDDPIEVAGFQDAVQLRVAGHGCAIELRDDNIYMAISVRNGGAGLAVLDQWHIEIDGTSSMSKPNKHSFRRLTRDLYIPAGTSGFWEGAIRDPNDPDYAAVRQAIEQETPVSIDLLYGDHDGGQRTIARFRNTWDRDGFPEGCRIGVIRYWNVDGSDPR